MDRLEHIRPNFPEDAYAGTASHYVRYRVPYPGRLLADLLGRSGVPGAGSLLDLACGPGRVALALAHSFREVWAIDLEPEMIEIGRSDAGRRKIENVTWMLGRAEYLEAPPDSFELITIGEAFHRLDQQIVASKALDWLKPGGCLATLGCDTVLSGREPWQQIVRGAVFRRLPNRGNTSKKPGSGPEHNERVLRESGFVDVASYPFVEVHEWTIDAIFGYLYSTSVCSKAVLGGDAERFESDLKAALLAYDPSGVYRENTQWGYTFGRKPN
jgi:ubiquinone/menaquinone biosynthesis C-methylase UbiE